MAIKLKSLLTEQENINTTYKFNFVGITLGKMADRTIFNLKFDSIGLNNALINTEAKNTGTKYSYHSTYINATKYVLQNQLGMLLKFNESSSVLGTVVFTSSRKFLSKDDLIKISQLKPIPIIVTVKNSEQEGEQNSENPPEQKKITPAGENPNGVSKKQINIPNEVPKTKNPQ